MKNGDISNETPRRIIVSADVIAHSDVVEVKRLLLSNTTERVIKGLNNPALSHLWRMANQYGLSVELAAFAEDNWTQSLLDKLMERLDRRGTNPFNYAELYETVDDFVSDIPYRPNLQGIIDVPGRVARYGSKGIELFNL